MTAQTFAALAPGSCSLTQPPRDFDSNPYYLRTARLSDNPVGAASAALCQVIFLIASNLARPVAYGRPAFPSATSEVRDAREAAEGVAEDVAGAEPFFLRDCRQLPTIPLVNRRTLASDRDTLCTVEGNCGSII